MEPFPRMHPMVYENGTIHIEPVVCEVLCIQDANFMLLYYALMMVIIFLAAKGLGFERYIYKRTGQRVDLSWAFGAGMICYLVSMMLLSVIAVNP